jgi:hypothetical protein
MLSPPAAALRLRLRAANLTHSSLPSAAAVTEVNSVAEAYSSLSGGGAYDVAVIEYSLLPPVEPADVAALFRVAAQQSRTPIVLMGGASLAWHAVHSYCGCSSATVVRRAAMECCHGGSAARNQRAYLTTAPCYLLQPRQATQMSSRASSWELQSFWRGR